MRTINSFNERPMPIFRVWTYAQDICPYTHEPLTEPLILSDEQCYPSEQRLQEIAAQSKLTVNDLRVDQTTRFG